MRDDAFETDLITIVDYPSGASGKFLSYALCFNDGFHPQSPHYMPDGAQRRAYIIDEMYEWARLRSSGEVPWGDLRMGDACFFGVQNFNEDRGTMAEVPEHRLALIGSAGVHHACLSRGLRFFRNVHNGDTARFYQAVWPNARRLSLRNCAAWIALRNRHGLSLQPFKPRESAQDVDPHDGYEWDCEDFSSWDRFLLAYTRLLLWFGETPMNIDELHGFYRMYVSSNIPWLTR